jgi:hypothetical protein
VSTAAEDLAILLGTALGDDYNLNSEGQASENLFIQDMPNDPDNAIAVYQYGGMAPRQTMGNAASARRPRVQVIVRNGYIDVAFADAQRVFDILHYIKHQTINGVFYRRVEAVADLFELGPDE